MKVILDFTDMKITPFVPITEKSRKDRKGKDEASFKLCTVRQRIVSENASVKNQPRVTLNGGGCRENDNGKAPPIIDVYFLALKPPTHVLHSKNYRDCHVNSIQIHP